MNQPTSSDQLVDCTFHVGLTNDVGPVDQLVDELTVGHVQTIENLAENLLLNSNGGIFLFNSNREPLKECLIQDTRSDEVSCFIALTFGIGGGDDGETRLTIDVFINLLKEDALTFQHGLETHDFRRCQIHFVKKKDCTLSHGLDDRAVEPNGLTVNQPKTTQQIVFVSLDSDVHTEHFTFGLCTCLFNHKRLTVT